MGIQSKLRLARNLIPRHRWRIVSGDMVQIINGTDKGHVGKVMRVYRKKNRVKVEGANLACRRVRMSPDQPWQLITHERSLHYSNILLLDPVNKRPVRVGIMFDGNGKRVRVSRGRGSSESVIPKPTAEDSGRRMRPARDGPKDTLWSDAARVTYCGDPAQDYLQWMEAMARRMAQVRLEVQAEHEAGKRVYDHRYITSEFRGKGPGGHRPEENPDVPIEHTAKRTFTKRQRRVTTTVITEVPIPTSDNQRRKEEAVSESNA